MSLRVALQKLEQERADAQAELARPRPDLVEAFSFQLPKLKIFHKNANILVVNQIVTVHLQSLRASVAGAMKATNQFTLLLGNHHFFQTVMELMEANQAEADVCQQSIKELECLNAKHQLDKIIEEGVAKIKTFALKIVGLKNLHSIIPILPTDVVRIAVDYIY